MKHILAAAVALLTSLPALAQDTYRVGVAQVDITPEHPIRLNGFGSRRDESSGVYHRIWAKAIAVEDESHEPALLITLDVLGIPDDLRVEIARRLHNKSGLKPERLSITATHTHTGPMLKGANTTIFGMPIPPEHLAHIDRYTAVFLDKVEKVGLTALDKREPARLSYGIGSVGFATNRRTKGGPVDHDLPVLFVHDLQGKVRAVYTSYATHCVTLSHNKIGGDWAGFAQDAIQDAFPGAMALVSIGCGADSNPSSDVTGDRVEAATVQGRTISAEVRRLAQQFRTPIHGRVIVKWKQLELPLAPLPSREQWEEKAKQSGAIGYHARVQLAKLARNEKLASQIDYPVQTWAIGDSLAMVFLSGEVVVDYSLRLKRELDGHRLWINAYSNGAPCYIPSERVLKEGGYEGGDAMIYYDQPTVFQPGLEAPIIAAVHEQIGKAFAAKYSPVRTGSSKALSPQQSLAAIRCKSGLTVELMAAEPMVVDPVAIDFGPDGKLWVAEMVDYPQGKAGRFEPGGRIRTLEAADGTTRFDKATVFLDDIPFPTGVTVWRKGVLVCAAPDILYAEDTDGDGKADVVKKLYSGFGTENFQARVNSLQYGLDGWVYGSCGLFGGTIRSFNGQSYALGNRDFRIRPDTGELEPVTGCSQQGRVRNDWGDWFGCDNSNLIRHYALTDHYLKRNPLVAAPNGSVSVPHGPHPNRLYPASADRQLFKLSGPLNTVTAACGLGFYRDDLLGPDFTGNSFTCEPVHLVVHRRKLSPQQSTFIGLRADDEQQSEFLSSTDKWFRPVQAVTGPDGALWIVDMYRFVIEHPRWIPPEELAKLDVRAGQGMGRIYRVVPSGAPPRRWERLDRFGGDGLVAALDSPNAWQRDMAAQLLTWRADGSAVTKLERLTSAGSRPEARLLALTTLDALGRLQARHVLAALADSHPGVRCHAVRLSEQFPTDSAVRERVLTLVGDRDAQVRLQVAYSLGAWDSPAIAPALADLALAGADDPFLQSAVLSSMSKDNVAPVLEAMLGRAAGRALPPGFMGQLVRMSVALNDESIRQALMQAATSPHTNGYADWQYTAVAAILGRAGTPLPAEMLDKASLVIAAARRLLLDPEATDDSRTAALPLLGNGGKLAGDDLDALRRLLGPTSSPTLRAAAVARIGKLNDDSTTALLLETWRNQTPKARVQILDVMLSRATATQKLMDAIDNKLVAPSEIDAAQRQRFLTHKDDGVRSRAGRVFSGAANPDRARVIEAYAGLSASTDRDRGKAVFSRVCSACHKLDGTGAEVGPDLAGLANRNAAYFLQEVLDPNRNVDSRYVEYRATTNSGRVVSGVLKSETATSIVLAGQHGQDETLLRSDIEELQSSAKSLMPEGLEKDLPKQDMADLLAYLAGRRPPRRVFPGNAPALVGLTRGQLSLRATQAELYGASIAFEPDFNNVGMWHGANDSAEWRVAAGPAGSFDVFLDFACEKGSSGNAFVIESGDSVIRGTVPSTGAWSNYRVQKVGTLQLAAGESRLVMRPDGKLHNALIDLRAVFLVPRGEQPRMNPPPP